METNMACCSDRSWAFPSSESCAYAHASVAVAMARKSHRSTQSLAQWQQALRGGVSQHARSIEHLWNQASAGRRSSVMCTRTDDHTWRYDMHGMYTACKWGTVNPQHRRATFLSPCAAAPRTERPLGVPYGLSWNLEICCKNIPDQKKLTM